MYQHREICLWFGIALKKYCVKNVKWYKETINMNKQ